MDNKRIIEMAVSDAMTEKPIEFEVGEKTFTVNPPTLGKMQVLSKYYLALEIDDKELGKHPQVESMRVCEAKTDIVCSLMAASTLDSREDLLNDDKIAELADFFKWNCKPSDFSLMLLALLTQVRYENFISSIRLAAILRQNKPK
ncbi:MAG: hypothetical protein J5733_11810 [Bacteroidaceae bacterium]|nr:hypothetical protein [Bacteroidaceae bacterium]